MRENSMRDHNQAEEKNSSDDDGCRLLRSEREIEENFKKLYRSEPDNGCTAVKWDGSKTGLVYDTDSPFEKSGIMGIQLKYKIAEQEAFDYLRSYAGDKNYKKIQTKYTIIHSLIIILLASAAISVSSWFYWFLIIIPVLTIVGIWIIPQVKISAEIKEITDCGFYCVDIFRESILVKNKGKSKEILLDGESIYRETDSVMIISSPDGDEILIPLRVIEPEYLPDVQAIISAGTHPV